MKRHAVKTQKRSVAGVRRVKRPVGEAGAVREARAANAAAAPEAAPVPMPSGARVTSGDAIAIRPVRATDIAQVIAIDEQITGLAKPEYWQSLFQRYSSHRQREIFFLVAAGADDGAAGPVLGFIVGEIRAWEFGSAPCGWVYTLSVRPEVRLRGLGQTLFEQISSEFKHAGVRKMRTMVARNNPLPMQFFRAAGMTAGPYIELEKELD